jgi:hypothetical protein
LFGKITTKQEPGMNKQGRLEVKSSNDILDRIGGLEKVIFDSDIDSALRASSKSDSRKCLLNQKVMMWVVLAMGLFTDLPIRQVFKACRRIREKDQLPGRSALCLARQRLGSQPLVELHRIVVRPLADHQTPWAFYKGMRKVGVDGSIFDVPDCQSHQHLGRASGSRGEGPFPQMRKLSLVELGTRVELALTTGAWHGPERAMLTRLVDFIPDDALLMLDAGFYSYEVWKSLHFKHKLLFRVQKSMALEPLKVFEDGSYLAKVYHSNWYRKNDSGGILVRVIEYTLNDPQRTGHQEKHVLLTNLLEDDLFTARELICEYHERWEEEIMFDEQKTHQDPVRAEKPTNFRSETTDGLKQEVYALSLAHFVTRFLMLQAAIARGIDVDRLSFKGCFQIIKTRLPEFHPSEGTDGLNNWFKAVLWEMGRETIPRRRNRINPRVIKRKMSRWDKKQPHHRKIPPLKKQFEDCIVMLR